MVFFLCFSVSVFPEEAATFDPLETLHRLVQFVNTLSNIGLQVEQDNTVLMHYVLDFYAVVSHQNQQYWLGQHVKNAVLRIFWSE